MNSCVLMAEIVSVPELRYTSENQTPISEMEIEFAGLRSDDPPVRIKALGWGNIAQEIHTGYTTGDRVILKGRLNMNTVDRPEGFREKRAELTIEQIEGLGLKSPTLPTNPTSPAPLPVATSRSTPLANPTPSPDEMDDIPF